MQSVFGNSARWCTAQNCIPRGTTHDTSFSLVQEGCMQKFHFRENPMFNSSNQSAVKSVPSTTGPCQLDCTADSFCALQRFLTLFIRNGLLVQYSTKRTEHSRDVALQTGNSAVCMSRSVLGVCTSPPLHPRTALKLLFLSRSLAAASFTDRTGHIQTWDMQKGQNI